VDRHHAPVDGRCRWRPPHRGDNNDLLPGRHCTSLDDALTIFADEPLLFRPGTNYRFAIYGWILLTAVVEGAAQEPFHTFMTRDVFEPLGMKRTAIEETDEGDDLTAFYGPRAFMRSALGLHEASANDYACYAGAGAFLSTPSDLVRLGSAMVKPAS
jgi:CubicO group peptidase (beta-lactamase class C family)